MHEEVLSPDQRYKLRIHRDTAGATGFGHLRIEVLRSPQDSVIGETTRNYGNALVLHFVSQDDVDYLVLSEDYHGGYGVMNLHTGEKVVYNPPEDPANPNEQFWCWAAPFAHDPVAKTLTILGCYWACPYERTTFDFSRPMQPPYAVLSVVEDQCEEDVQDQEEI